MKEGRTGISRQDDPHFQWLFLGNCKIRFYIAETENKSKYNGLDLWMVRKILVGMARKIHRRGVEPLPLAWKASMITASPSVSKTLSLVDALYTLYIFARPQLNTSYPQTLLGSIPTHPPCSTSEKAHCVWPKITRKVTQIRRLKSEMQHQTILGDLPVRRWTRSHKWPTTSAHHHSPRLQGTRWLRYHRNDFVEIMEMLDKRLNDKGKNWRHVFKVRNIHILAHNVC